MSESLTLPQRVDKLREEIESSQEYWYISAKGDLSEIIYRRMEECGMSKAGFAEALGVSRPRVSAILSGDENMTMHLLVRIAQALGCKLNLRGIFAPTKPTRTNERTE